MGVFLPKNSIKRIDRGKHEIVILGSKLLMMEKTSVKQYSKFNIKILVIEDDPTLREILEEVFTQEGYQARYYSSVIDILPLIEESVPDLVLLDYVLPEVNGGELCCQIKRHKKYNKIPVIIYSAFSRVLLSLGDYGCDAFFEKPFDLNVLLRKIEELVIMHRKVA